MLSIFSCVFLDISFLEKCLFRSSIFDWVVRSVGIVLHKLFVYLGD